MEWLEASQEALRAYLLGACKDATESSRHKTIRIGQSDIRWLERLKQILSLLRTRSWIYREGSNRRFWILETTAPFLRQDFNSPAESKASWVRDYARGYFDADGGMPRDFQMRLYFQYVQKNRDDLAALRDSLVSVGIKCGALHNPSRRVAPDYWRFFIAAASHVDFMTQVGSWHPAKEQLIAERLGWSDPASESFQQSLCSP